MPPILFLAAADLYSSFSSHQFCTAFIIFLLLYMTFEHCYQSRLWQTLCVQACCSGHAAGKEGSYWKPKWQWKHSVWAPDSQAAVHTECERGRRKIPQKSKQRNRDFFPAVSTTLHKSSIQNKKQLPQVSNWTTRCLLCLQKAMHLLDCMSCPFCLQKTLVTFSNSLADHNIFARLPWPTEPSHHKAPLSYLVWAASPAV